MKGNVPNRNTFGEGRRAARSGVGALDHTDRLRRLATNDERLAEELIGGAGVACAKLDPRTLALVRLAALVAVGGTLPSYGALADAAVTAGASTAEIVEVLIGVVDIVGLPCVVSAAPDVATALGYDIDEALER
jgi:4-carboxymuconolactone decarboxylase